MITTGKLPRPEAAAPVETFPTPIEEPRKVMKVWYLGSLQVRCHRGMVTSGTLCRCQTLEEWRQWMLPSLRRWRQWAGRIGRLSPWQWLLALSPSGSFTSQCMHLTILLQLHGRSGSLGVSCPLPFLPWNWPKRPAGRFHHAHSAGESSTGFQN